MVRIKATKSLLFAGLSLLPQLFLGAEASEAQVEEECSVLFTGSRVCSPVTPPSFLPAGVVKTNQRLGDTSSPDVEVLSEVINAISVMQSEYFASWLGTWPDSIDWTGAVMGTHVSGALHSFSEALPLMNSSNEGVESWKLKENLIENYFSQIISYYFGEDAIAIQGEAFDDILWVVLGWLEAVKFINTHTNLYYKLHAQGLVPETRGTDGISTILRNQTWHGNLWVPGFSHRARIFWDLSSKGWDTHLCGGGMTWNPQLLPYKNAITNELFIAASVSMYLYFPGDDNQSPFFNTPDKFNPKDPDMKKYVGPKAPKFLKAAVDGYRWLASSNMTNSQGLFTDGFHISGYANSSSNNTKCDQRNEMVFTYNQGVLLTGQRGLWEATGTLSYLADGHKLIQNAINATGYDLRNDKVFEDLSALRLDKLPRWHGLGRAGVMEDQCDSSGTCSQDSQTFKGIFFHHLTAFCAPLAEPAPESDDKIDSESFKAAKASHKEACALYGNWLKHNAEAALATRDADGKFGSWWTAGLLANFTGLWPATTEDSIEQEAVGVDYRSYGVPVDSTWGAETSGMTDANAKVPVDSAVSNLDEAQKPISGPSKHAPMGELRNRQKPLSDPNNRGRGRTVESQGSGLALLRAYWNLAQAP